MRSNRIAPFLYSFTALVFALAAQGAETAAESGIVDEGKINVRGKPSFVGEVITQLERGDKVTVLERITVEKPREGEPTNWAKIKLPENTPAWVFAPFIKDGKVAATRLNLRAGPGENYSVIGRLNRGEEVKTIRTVAEWMEIEAPENAYAFIDLGLIRFGEGTNSAPAVPAGPTVAAAAQPEPTAEPAPAPPETATTTAPATSTPVATTEAPPQPATETPAQPAVEEKPLEPAPPIVPSTSVAPAPEQPSTAASVPEKEAEQPTQAAQPLPQVAERPPTGPEEPLPKRIVRREGIIRATRSIQAPTWFELGHAETGKTINYLYDAKLSEKLGIKMKDYRGQKVVVTGQEAIDPRWPNTPILDMESLDVVP